MQSITRDLIALFHRAKRGSRDFHSHTRPIIKRDTHRAQVWKQTPFSFIIRVADIIAYHRGFPAKKTSSCHFFTFEIEFKKVAILVIFCRNFA